MATSNTGGAVATVTIQNKSAHVVQLDKGSLRIGQTKAVQKTELVESLIAAGVVAERAPEAAAKPAARKSQDKGDES